METSDPLSAAILMAFLKCPTKARFLVLGDNPQDTYFSGLDEGISSLYKMRAWRVLHDRGEFAKSANFGQVAEGDDDGTSTTWFDCNTTLLDLNFSHFGAIERSTKNSAPNGREVPVLFSPWEKPEISDSLLVCFGALSLSQSTRTQIETGMLIYGDNLRRRTIRISDHSALLNRILREIGSLLPGGRDPPLILNAHCSLCDFCSKCRGIAIERDDLSLLSGMSPKDRSKALTKGILTISQLSYGYRPRRRKRTKPDAERAARSIDAAHVRPPAKHDNKLKALAIKKGRIHVVGAPAIKLQGVPIYIDVEGMPDRDSYYLIGLRFESDGKTEERAFWADGPEDERCMWENCLRMLKSIGNAHLVHYGAYETRFLRIMKKRYVSDPNDIEFVDHLITSSFNLVTCIYGSIYFPTYSNSLKEVARHLGYNWIWPHASGAAAILLRKTWELSGLGDFKMLLMEYNMDDCRAASVVADALTRICAGEKSAPDSVDVGSLEVKFQRTFGKFDSALPEFDKINSAAYWDYQRSKVFVRTDKCVRRTVRKSERRRIVSRVEKEIMIDDTPEMCPRCSATKLWKYPPRSSNVVYDLRFSHKGVKRWVVKYRYGHYKCSECLAELTFYQRKSIYGSNLRAFLAYLVIELLLSNRKAAEHASQLFDLSINKSAVMKIKSEMAEKYSSTYQSIIKQISTGNLIHADETKGVVLGGGHYVWVFANMSTVAYVYSESRESSILEDLLDGFKGVLVSDFYAAYDTVPCPQQKCLIHLMRDINEDLIKNPFDEELKGIAGRFGELLREIIETVDRYGLKARHLGKHRSSAEGFIEHVAKMNCTTDVGHALQKRIEKNKDKLFTFLLYDGVPWNNNNAEHAVRAFTRLRNVINTSSPKGTRDYATLLSIQQTLQYRGRKFLEFMLSGETEISS